MSDEARPDVPEPRDAVRAVVLNGENRVLLFKAFSDKDRVRHFWIMPGGGITGDESDQTALSRELAEECGTNDWEIGPLVWVREHTFYLPTIRRIVRQRERFYLVRVDHHEVDITGWNEFERAFMSEPRWWTVDEIRASVDDFAPRRLADYLEDLVNGHIPERPLDTGV